MTAIVQVVPTRPRGRTVTSFFEFWPGWLFYIPTVTAWLLMGLRYRGFALPTAANPHIEAGGLCGERKAAILDQAGPAARELIAPYCTLTTGTGDLPLALSRMAETGLALPVVVKPNIGCNGTGVRLARDEATLATALAAFPRGVEVMLQQLVEHEHEAGLFYVRMPDEPHGHITSITLKRAPYVTGDGRSTLRELVLADPRYGTVPDIYLPRLADRLEEVLPAGERFRLVFAGNHCKGSVFENGAEHATAALERRVDAFLRDLPDFHFGRVDVKFESLAALRVGEGFTVIEINGVGSEATHIWDPATTLRDAYLDQFRHYRDAFRIGRIMRDRGFRPTRPFELLGYWMHQRRLMRSYPLND